MVLAEHLDLHYLHLISVENQDAEECLLGQHHRYAAGLLLARGVDYVEDERDQLGDEEGQDSGVG